MADAVLAFCVGASLMVVAGLVAVFFAVAAEQRSLEDIATPLSALGARTGPEQEAREGAKPGSPPGAPAV